MGLAFGSFESIKMFNPSEEKKLYYEVARIVRATTSLAYKRAVMMTQRSVGARAN